MVFSRPCARRVHNSALRPAVSARAGLPIDAPDPDPAAQASPPRAPESRLAVARAAEGHRSDSPLVILYVVSTMYV